MFIFNNAGDYRDKGEISFFSISINLFGLFFLGNIFSHKEVKRKLGFGQLSRMQDLEYCIKKENGQNISLGVCVSCFFLFSHKIRMGMVSFVVFLIFHSVFLLCVCFLFLLFVKSFGDGPV